MTVKVRYAALSDVGRVRKQNQDSWMADHKQGLFMVSDGMGGQARGDLASRIVVETLPPLLHNRLSGKLDLASPDTARIIKTALADLSRKVRDEGRKRPDLTGLGATLVAALVRGYRAMLFHMGDSRAYLLREGKLSRLTRDHSIVQMLLDSGEIQPQDAAHHPAKGRITQAIGMKGRARADTQLVELTPGDRLMLCCDGLTDMLTDGDIERTLRRQTVPDTACKHLVAMANANGGRDNITVVLVDWL